MALAASIILPSVAQTGYVPTDGNLKARKEFQDNKFGIFLHWGIYSMLGEGEWVMNNHNINWQEYAKIANGFYPSKFDAKAWVAAFKDAGAKYITITSRHHDGFSMFGSKVTDYNIVDATPFHRDVIKELADECHKQGININFYYSHLDWHRADYPLGNTGHGVGRDMKEDWNSYSKFMNDQLTELLSNYGKIGCIWFDGWWDQKQKNDFDWHLGQQYALIHKLQPDCLIGDNHHVQPFEGEDIQIFERDLPGENLAGYSKGTKVSQLPLETCQTMNRSWGFNITDNDYKSTTDLIRYLVKAAGMNANLLLNIGPQPDGEIPAAALQHLKEMGEWLKTNGETVYETRGGIVAPHDWGVTTQKDNKLFVHIFNLKDKGLYLPINQQKIAKAVLFKDKSAVKFKQDKDGVYLTMNEVPSGVDYIIELILK